MKNKMFGYKTFSVILLGIVAISFLICPAAAQDINDLLSRTSIAMAAGDYSSALHLVKKGLKNQPENIFLLNNLGLIYIKTNRINMAEKVFKNIYDNNKDNLFSALWYSVTLIKQKRFREAVTVLTALLKIYPDNAQVYYHLGMIYKIERNTEQALIYLQRAGELDTAEPEFHYNLARAFRQLGENRLAVKEYNKTIELVPGYIKAYNGLGWAQFNENDISGAIQTWTVALQLSPGDKTTVFNLSFAYNYLAKLSFDSGDPEQSKKYLNKTLEVDKKNRRAKYNLKKLRGLYGS